MEIKHGVAWEKYFDQQVANCTALDQEKVEELKGDISIQYSLLELDDIEESTRLQKIAEMTDQLLSDYQKSKAVAESVIAHIGHLASRQPGGNSFPVADINDLPEIDDPSLHLEELMVELRQHGDYSRIRKEYCQFAILLNLQGRLAPAFRPVPVTGKKYGDKVFNEIHRDQLVIDCHWLHATQNFIKARAKDMEFAPLFKTAKPFPFSLAWDFACKKWTADHRAVDMLRLTEFQQCQLAALRSDKVKERIRDMTEGTRKNGRFVPSPHAVFTQGLNAWCERDRRICKHREGYEAVWKARSFLGEQESVRLVGELAAMMLGESPKDEKTTRSKEENIRRHISGGD